MPSRLSPRHLLVLPSAGDRELLRVYVECGDSAAFADLARRYTGLARRVAADICPSAADDVAQATLALLDCKARTVAERESAAGWVFETARRLAMKARTAAARRSRHEAYGEPPAPQPNPLDALSFREVRAAVAEEVARLPDDLRVPLVLCYWDGASQLKAANRLGCSLSTLKRRLDKGRERLAARLTRRGFAGSAVLAVLTALSCRAGRIEAAVTSFDESIEATIRPLGHALRVTHSIKPALLMMTAATVVAIGGLALGLSPAGDPPMPPKEPKKAEVAKVQERAVDAFGDPLPPGAVARLGTVRFRTSDFPKHVVASPDGKRLVTTAVLQHSRLAIWEAETGRPLREINLSGLAYPEAVCWLPDGRGRAAYKVGLKDYVVWEFTDPEAKPPVGDGYLSQGPGSFSASAFSPDGSLLAGGEVAGDQGTAGKLQVWPVHSGRPVREAIPLTTIDKPDGFVGLNFTRDGKRLVGITKGRQPARAAPAVAGAPPQVVAGAIADMARVFVWDVATWKEVAAFDVKAGGFAIDLSRSKRMAVSPDGKTLFTPTLDGHIKAFDLNNGKERFDVLAFGPPGEKAKQLLAGIKVQIGELAMTPDGKMVLAAEMYGRTLAFDAATGKELWRGGREMDPIYALTVFRDGNKFALGHGARLVEVYDMATGKPVVESVGHRGGMRAVGFADDGRTVITAGWDSAYLRWDLSTGRLKSRVEINGRSQACRFSPDGKMALDLGGVIDTTTGKAVTPATWPGMTPGAWLPDGSYVVSNGENSATHYAADGKRLRIYEAAPPGKPKTGPWVEGVAVSPDGKTVVLTGEGPPTQMTRSDMGWVAVFDVATGTKQREWQSKGTGGFTGAAFLPDSSLVVLSRSVSQPNPRPIDKPEAVLDLSTALVLFNPVTGDRTMPFDAPDPTASERWVRSVAVSPTGTQIAAVEWDNSLTVYETASGAIRRRLLGHRGSVDHLAFTPDGDRLVSVSFDGTGLVWDAAPPKPAAAVTLSDADQKRRWTALFLTEGSAAHQAMGELAADPASTLAFLKTNLKSTQAPTDAELDRLLKGMRAGAFNDREVATRELDHFGTLAVSKVRSKLPDVTSAEVRQRLEEFLKRHDSTGRTTGFRLREIRAVELLEAIGTPEARTVLSDLAAGDTPLARDAAAAMRRIRTR